MCKRTLEECQTEKDFLAYIKANPQVEMERCAKGVKVRGPQTPSDMPYGYVLIHCNHPREFATGTRHALIKALLKIGVLPFLVGVLYLATVLR